MVKKIDNYRFGSIVVSGKKYTSDLIIYKDSIYDNWYRKSGHSLVLDDLKWALQKNPATLIVGRGKYGVMTVPEKVKNELEAQGIELTAEKTDRACKIYNERADSEDVACALHLTC